MAKYRVGYLIFFIISTVLLFAYKSKLTTILFLFAVILPILSLLLSTISALLVKVSVTYESKTAEKFEPLNIKVTVKNRFIMPLAPINVICTLPMRSQQIFAYQDVLVSVPPFSSIAVNFGSGIKYRGIYSSGVEKIKIYDFLKLFVFTKKINKFENVTVLPRKLTIAPIIPESEGESEELSHNSFSLYKSTFTSVRDYRSSDSVKHIHWKLSAKYGKPLVKEFEKSIGGSSVIIPDLNEYFPFDDDNKEMTDCIIELMIAVNMSLCENKHECLDIWYSPEVGSCRSFVVKDAETFNALYKEISLLPRQTETFLPEDISKSCTKLPDDTSIIFFITSQIRKEFILKMNEIELFRNRKTVIMLLDDPLESVEQDELASTISEVRDISLWRINKNELVASVNENSKFYLKQNTEN